MIESGHNPFLLLLTPKLISPFCVSSNHIFNIIKLSYGISKVSSNYWFAIYYPYYKKKPRMTKSIYNLYMLYSDKLVSNLTQTSIFAMNCLCFEYSFGCLGNLSTVSFFACDSGACATKSDLITKKEKPPKTFLYFISHPL